MRAQIIGQFVVVERADAFHGLLQHLHPGVSEWRQENPQWIDAFGAGAGAVGFQEIHDAGVLQRRGRNPLLTQYDAVQQRTKLLSS